MGPFEGFVTPNEKQLRTKTGLQIIFSGEILGEIPTQGKGAKNVDRFRRHESMSSIERRVASVIQFQCESRAGLGRLPLVLVKGPGSGEVLSRHRRLKKLQGALPFLHLTHRTPVDLIEAFLRNCIAVFQAPRFAGGLS